MKCEYCDNGHIEVVQCDNPASMCCGGCVVWQTCDECNGNGEIEDYEN